MCPTISKYLPLPACTMCNAHVSQHWSQKVHQVPELKNLPLGTNIQDKLIQNICKTQDLKQIKMRLSNNSKLFSVQNELMGLNGFMGRPETGRPLTGRCKGLWIIHNGWMEEDANMLIKWMDLALSCFGDKCVLFFRVYVPGVFLSRTSIDLTWSSQKSENPIHSKSLIMMACLAFCLDFSSGHWQVLWGGKWPR